LVCERESLKKSFKKKKRRYIERERERYGLRAPPKSKQNSTAHRESIERERERDE
jgi:hypothetical protein